MGDQNPHPNVKFMIFYEQWLLKIFLNQKTVCFDGGGASWNNSDKLVSIKGCLLLPSLFYLLSTDCTWQRFLNLNWQPSCLKILLDIINCALLFRIIFAFSHFFLYIAVHVFADEPGEFFKF